MLFDDILDFGLVKLVVCREYIVRFNSQKNVRVDTGVGNRCMSGD